MNRPIDIRDIPPRDAVLGDKRLGLDSNDELAMTNQPDNSAIGTAASRNIGTAEDQIPLNSDLPASAKSGDYNDLSNLPTLGTAAAKNTGLNTGDVLSPEGAGLDSGEVNYTTGNLNQFAFGGIPGSIIGSGIARSATEATITIPLDLYGDIAGASFAGSFDVQNVGEFLFGTVTSADITFSPVNSNGRMLVFEVANLSSMTARQGVVISCVNSSSIITVTP